MAMAKDAVIVSRDPAVRLTARSMSLGAEHFKAESLSVDKKPYEGRCNLFVSGQELSSFAQKKVLKLDPKKEYCAILSLGSCCIRFSILSSSPRRVGRTFCRSSPLR